MEWFDTWGLSLIVFLPLVGALLVVLLPREQEESHKWISLITSAVVLILSVVAAAAFDYGAAKSFQYEVNESWISAIGANYHVGIDGISLPLLVLSGFVTLLSIIYSWNHWEEPQGLPGPDAGVAHGNERDFCSARSGAVLHLLRASATADVLHDRYLG